MTNRAIPIKQRTRTDGMDILSIWDVSATPSYHVAWDTHWNAALPANATIAWFTLHGSGRLSTPTGQLVELQEDSVMFSRLQDMGEYACTGPHWRFFWIMFVVPLTAHIPVCEPIHVPSRNRYAKEITTAIKAIQKNTDAQRSLGAAIFLRVFHEWLVLVETQHRNIPQLKKIEQAIDAMHSRLDGTLSLAEMARTAGMNEVIFRKRFKTASGLSPKRFYLELRLDQAEALLRQGQYSVGDVATLLGFYDQFHFSKVFAKRFGKPPSKLKQLRLR